MQNEKHREMAVAAFARYEGGEFDRLGRVKSIRLSSLKNNELIEKSRFSRCIYVLRLSDEANRLDPSIASITASSDARQILYIGGHDSKFGDHSKNRFNVLLKAIRGAQKFYESNGYAHNDKDGKGWGHPITRMLTTQLLSLGLRIDKHCILEIIDGDDDVDELDLIIGYQERYHHLPPWNAHRKGSSAFA